MIAVGDSISCVQLANSQAEPGQTQALLSVGPNEGKGWPNPNSNEAYAKLPVLTEEHPLCPVFLLAADLRSNVLEPPTAFHKSS